MPPPTLTQVWYTRANAPFPDVSTQALLNKSWLWMLKAFLKDEVATGTIGPEGARTAGSLWVCIGSSDGVTANMTGTDLWTNAFDASKIVQAANGVAHSWIVLQNVAAGIYLCIDCNSATTTTAGFIWSKSAFSGGTNLTRPTASNSWSIGTASAPAATTNYIFLSDSAAAATNGSFSTTAAGNFVFVTARTTQGICNSFTWHAQNVDLAVNDVHPNHVAAHNLASSRGAGSWVSALANGYANPGAGFYSRNWGNGGYATSGGANRWAFGATEHPGFTNIQGNEPNWLALPVEILDIAPAGSTAWRGRVPDLFVVGNAPVGSAYPTMAAVTQQVVGSVLIPMSVLLIL